MLIELGKQDFMNHVDTTRATVKCERVGQATILSYRARSGRVIGLEREHQGVIKYFVNTLDKS